MIDTKDPTYPILVIVLERGSAGFRCRVAYYSPLPSDGPFEVTVHRDVVVGEVLELVR